MKTPARGECEKKPIILCDCKSCDWWRREENYNIPNRNCEYTTKPEAKESCDKCKDFHYLCEGKRMPCGRHQIDEHDWQPCPDCTPKPEAKGECSCGKEKCPTPMVTDSHHNHGRFDDAFCHGGHSVAGWEDDFRRRVNDTDSIDGSSLLNAEEYPDPRFEIDQEKVIAFIRDLLRNHHCEYCDCKKE